jgi:hypothetical protein
MVVLFQNASCFRNLFRVQVDHVLVPHAAQLDPLHTEFARRDVACTGEGTRRDRKIVAEEVELGELRLPEK